jgi:hypothetical protein
MSICNYRQAQKCNVREHCHILHQVLIILYLLHVHRQYKNKLYTKVRKRKIHITTSSDCRRLPIVVRKH